MKKNKNLLKKYNITKEQLDLAIDQGVNLGKVGNAQAMLALCELITEGDISSLDMGNYQEALNKIIDFVKKYGETGLTLVSELNILGIAVDRAEEYDQDNYIIVKTPKGGGADA